MGKETRCNPFSTFSVDGVLRFNDEETEPSGGHDNFRVS